MKMKKAQWFRPAARIFSVAVLLGAKIVRAEDMPMNEPGGFLSIIDENDAWSNPFGPHQDRHYTHGSKVTWLAGADEWTNTAAWLNHIPQWGINASSGRFGFSFGQSMFTPENILNPQPILTDRPYAGWLYGGAVFERRSDFNDHAAVLESFELELGIVGPGSQAAQVQRFIHEWRFPEDVPAGWGNQIKDEPGILLKYGRLWRWSPNVRSGKYIDVIARAGFDAGNVNTSGTGGATLRLGWNLPDDFGVQIIDSPAAVNGGLNRRQHDFSVYAFAGADGRYVVHDITLDGNSYQTSQNVRKYDWVNDLSWGVAVQPCAHLEISYDRVSRSKEFSGQLGKDDFGSVDFKFMCRF